jgi:hypothetical protein
MARVIALAHSIDRTAQLDLLRAGIVIGCAIALIAAGQVVPKIF